MEQRDGSAQSYFSLLLFLAESSLSVLVVNKYIKISPCCSPWCRNIVSSEDQRQDFPPPLPLSIGNDEWPQVVVLHLLHVPPWKIHVQHTKLWQHQKHLLHVTAGKAESVVEALGSW